ncbi:hypothetical protein [Aggregatibacter actinomycetemcomitans]|uniref:hypothetical protein n=1 Tax=Aggregatibacter actinomycetemcomitans TaxID=714 RepID=UPI001651B1FE|nr:hypothetical protein [Aggregatibacter actinomycetemcomitans]
MQYRETDFAFIERLAAEEGGIIILRITRIAMNCVLRIKARLHRFQARLLITVIPPATVLCRPLAI